jgi:two-component system, chemotaxis family, sensor kinase CheA
MTENDRSREPMLEMYLFETNQLIEQLEAIIIRCEKSQKLETGDIDEIFRFMHTIKSSSAMMMFNEVSLLAHALEDLFYFIRGNKRASFNFGKLSDLVLAGIDFIKGETAKIEDGSEATSSAEKLIAKIKSYLETVKADTKGGKKVAADTRAEEPTKYYISKYEAPANEEKTKYCARIFFDDDCQMENVRSYTVVHNMSELVQDISYIPSDILENNDTVEQIRQEGFLLFFSSAKERSELEKRLNATMFLRKLELSTVEADPEPTAGSCRPKTICLDATEECAGPDATLAAEPCEPGKEEEAAIGGGRPQSIISVNVTKLDMLMDLVGEIVISEAMVTRNPELAELNLDGFHKAARQLRKLTTELQDIVMSIRMVPISTAFQKMQRVVRDMTRRLDKDVELEIIGETTEVDKNVIDHLSDPLIHLIRNAMDHGLETKEERAKAGKPKKGRIVLEALNVGGDVWVMVKDDGRGMDREKILAKAREFGLVNKPESELTDREVFSYILLPGFSTKEKVTEFSGRGVGMDVVRQNIEQIGGTITIESVLGKGTEFQIKIPLTLAIIDGMEIGVGRSKYTLPTTSIRESFKAATKDIIADPDGNEMIMIRGRCYPVFRIHKIFNIETAVTTIGEGIMVMVESETKSACLFADRLIGEQQVVVKALPAYIKNVSGVAGCTILGDGSISLILDVNGILDKEM